VETHASHSHSHYVLPQSFFARQAEQVAPDLISFLLLKCHQLTITYPEGDAQQLHKGLLMLKRSRCLNISSFCREVIAEKLERLAHQEAGK
jgi:hypothetical protein